MSLTFPSNPSLNQLYTYGSNIWVWDGSAWEIYSNPSPSFNNITATGAITVAGASTFSGGITGNIIGNASTATALQTPRKINGTNFDGTADITIKTTTTTTSATPPQGPASGDRWFNSNTGIEYVYLNSSWVQPYTVSYGSSSGGGGGGVNLSAFSVGANATPSGSGGLAYDNNTGIFTYTPPVITGYTLPTATVGTSTTGTKGGVKVDGTSITISNGVISASAAVPYTLPTAVAGTPSTGTLGGVIPDGSTITILNGVITATLTNVTGLSSRATVQTTTTSLTSGSSTTATVQAAKGYALYSIQSSVGAWVTVYTSSTAQSSDSSRSISTDPTPGSGVVAEAITTIAGTTYFTPAVYGYNADGSVTTNMYLKIYNNSGSTNAITVTITYLQLEV
jgi:hypothetical protein